MIADAKLTISYMNPALVSLLQAAESDLKKELPRFSVSTLIGSNIDVFHKNPSHQRQMLAALQKPHAATIRIGSHAFDLLVTPLMKGAKRSGFVVEWADAKNRLQNLDYTAQIAAIGRSQAIIEFTPEGVILNANDNFLAVTGYALGEIKGKHHGMFMEPAARDHADYHAFWKDLGRGEYRAGEFKRVAKGGREFWIQGSYNPIFDLDGKVAKVVKFATEVTQRIRAVAEIGSALTALADGDLELRIEQPLTAELDKLRTDLNRACETLQGTMQRVGRNSRQIKGGTEEIRSSTDDLSRRTEQQAASLEETAAALDEITATVRTTSDNAIHAREVVGTAKSDAENSAVVVRKAVEAMNGIKASSTQISQIIGVIDEIAFQTNLLALNAGVEAARAGEAGRGFAVVASEVRALAQRSAEAAKEIKTLISTSAGQVDDGVELVGQTGSVLEKIIVQVAEISDIVSGIADAAQEQSTALQEVNTAVNQMDQVTQQNAAMVEETTAAAHALAQEASELSLMVDRFRVGESHDEAAAPPSARGKTVVRLPQGRALRRSA